MITQIAGLTCKQTASFINILSLEILLELRAIEREYSLTKISKGKIRGVKEKEEELKRLFVFGRSMIVGN